MCLSLGTWRNIELFFAILDVKDAAFSRGKVNVWVFIQFKHFTVDLLAQTIVASVSFITIIVCKFVLQTTDLHRTRPPDSYLLIFWAMCLVCSDEECGYSGAGRGSGCHPGPSSNGYDWSLTLCWLVTRLSHPASSQRAIQRPAQPCLWSAQSLRSPH